MAVGHAGVPLRLLHANSFAFATQFLAFGRDVDPKVGPSRV